MYEIGNFFKRSLNLGKPSKDEMFHFMTETDRRAKANKAVDGVPTKEDLSRLSRILRIINREAPEHSFFHNYSNKYISLHQNIGENSGLVYHGLLVKTHPYDALPHQYGEFAYRYVNGSIYYAGYFDCGIPWGECRISIEGIKDCYGIMRGFGEHDKIKLSFSPHD
jgi:hypothetical protein